MGSKVRPDRRVRRWAWVLGAVFAVLAWVLNASRTGTRVQALPVLKAQASGRGDDTLRVMSLNMLHGFPRFSHLADRLRIIADEIQRLDPDLVCLQEVPWTPHLGNAASYLAGRCEYNYVYLRANGNRWAILFEEGEAILSRYPLRDVAFTELMPRAGLFEHRVVLRATASTPFGDVGVFVTHLTNGDPQVNLAQTESLRRFVVSSDQHMTIVAGDFNAEANSPQIGELTGHWIDTYRAVHPHEHGDTCCVGDLTASSGPLPSKRIDYIFLVPVPDSTASVVDSQRVLDQPIHTSVGWLRASDHAGLLTTIGVR